MQMGSQENQKPETIKPLDPEEFRRQGHMVVDFLADYYRNVDKYPVRSQVEPGYLRERLPESAPDEPEPIEKNTTRCAKGYCSRDHTLAESKLFCLFSLHWKHCWISW
ncbi:Tyrosine decarboxylase 1 [Abeliophyllum distichum]|uniref:Tyrosine decarboxylase 1 n=1 Tax=Abeliophyllum distichum TaxID=126358 RepID=A0ABD1UFJ9_9LAMI